MTIPEMRTRMEPVRKQEFRDMDIQKNGFLSIEQLTDRYFGKKPNVTETRNAEGLSFQEILQQKSSVKFSKHATGRLAERNISLTEEKL